MTESAHNPAYAHAAELKNIRFSYDRGNSWALDGVSLTVRAGERICLVGPNGSGKSTFARLIAGLAAPDGGDITLLGHRAYADALPNADEYRAARRGIGVVFQNPEDQLVTTVLEDDVAFGPENLGIERSRIGERIDDSLKSVGLVSFRQSDPTRMSGGQQQRAAIAGMLAMSPAMLVLDEPTAMLDESARAEVMRILDDLQAQGTTIVHVTHHQDETVHADRIVHMESGQIVGIEAVSARPQTIANHPSPDEPHQPGRDVAFPLLGCFKRRRHRPHHPGFACDISISLGQACDHQRPVVHYRARQTVALMGANGSGKSTLIRLLCALATPRSGSIDIANVPVATSTGTGTRSKSATRQQLVQLRRHVGYVMQHPEHQLLRIPWLKMWPMARAIRDWQKPKSPTVFTKHWNCCTSGTLPTAPLSTYQVDSSVFAAIAGVIACNPDVLIMDEPTASLDTQAKERIHELLRTLKQQGVTVLLITHDRAEAEALADRVVRMPNAAEQPDSPASDALNNSNTEALASNTTSASADAAFSVIHRLDPRVKMVGFLAAMFTMFAVNTPVQLVLGLMVTLTVIAAARLNPLWVLKSIHPLLMLMLLMGVVNLFVVRTGTPVVALGPLSITDQGVTIAVLYTCRFMLVIILGTVFLTTTTPTAMTDAFAALIKPLNRLGVHAQEIALVMSLALRFIPTLTDETRAIIDAQSARGGSIETGSLGQRIKAMSAIIVPTFAGTLRHADNLSLALDARCYEEGIHRTHWRALSIAGRDIVFAALVIAYIASIILL